MRARLASAWFAAALFLLLANTAQSAPLWGTLTDVSLGDMFPNGGQNNFSFDMDGPVNAISGLPEGGDSATHSLIDDATQLDSRGQGPFDRGTAEASATLQGGGVATPAILRARSVLTGNTSNQAGVSDAAAFAQAFASDAFVYVGPNAANLSITFTLTGELANSPADPTFQTLIAAAVAVFGTTNYDFTPDLDGLRFGLGAVVKDLDNSTLFMMGDTGGLTSTLQTTLSFGVVPGEQFYVWQSLSAWAAGNARAADAFSTMTATFDQPHLVQSLSVPEPGSGMLVVTGFAALMAFGGGRRQRRRVSSRAAD